MEIIRNLDEIPYLNHGVISIGKFDGMHLGHRKVIEEAIKISEREDRKLLIISFNNHPFEIVKPDQVPKRISNEKFKVDYLERIGCDYLILIDFSEEIMKTTHIDFLNFLLKKVKYIHFVLGFDFKFGKNNVGDINFLREFSNENPEKLNLTVIEKIERGEDDKKISSTLIKKLLKDGEIKKSNYYLNREYYIEGKIIEGDRIGSKIGFPTINMYIEKMEYPKDGVYFTRVEVDEDNENSINRYGMTYVGRRLLKGFKKEVKLVETYIFDFNKIIYGKNARIYFLDRIRDVIEFDSLESLKNQLINDKNHCLSLLEEKCL
jgi:riboflavin kinase/FMN adenylyltransferase